MSIPATLEEIWDVYDKRLPTVVDRALDQDYYDFVANLRKQKIFIHPIAVGKLSKEWPFIAGRKRLLAARQLKEEGMSEFDYISVRVFKVKDMDEVVALRLSENTGRSDNLVADYLAMMDILRRTNDYKAVASQLGIPLKDVKYMDKNLSPVPRDVLSAVVSGTVALSTAIKVGKIPNPQTKKAMVKILKKTGSLTGADVDAARYAIQQEASGKLSFVDSVVDQPVTRHTFSREELHSAFLIAQSESAQRTSDYLSSLLQQ